MRYHKLLSNNKEDRRSGKSSDSKTVCLLSFVFASRCCNVKACSNEVNIMQHYWANENFARNTSGCTGCIKKKVIEL